MTRRVAVTGLGLVSPFGDRPQDFFDALLAGRSAVARHLVGEPPHETRTVSAVCEGFDASALAPKPQLLAMDRGAQLALASGLSAWRDAGLEALPAAERERVGVCWGTGAGGVVASERAYRDLFVRGRERVSPLTVVLGMHNAPASQIALRLGLGGACLTYSVACASSSVAIGEALARLRRGECSAVVAGGSEAAMPYALTRAWQAMQVLAEPPDGEPAAGACAPFDLHRRGLVPGEGAAALVLEDWDAARRRGARIYAELAGYGASCDHHHLTAPSAAGQVRALDAALHDAGAAADEVGYVNAHGTGTVEGDPVEIAALRQVFGVHAPRLALSSTKAAHGHLMGAAGAAEALVTVLALARRALPPTATLQTPDPACAGVDHVAGSGRDAAALRLALSNSFAFGGSNAVLAFRAVG